MKIPHASDSITAKVRSDRRDFLPELRNLFVAGKISMKETWFALTKVSPLAAALTNNGHFPTLRASPYIEANSKLKPNA